MRALMLFLLLACTFNIAHAREFSARIIAVLDGDTVLIRRAGGLVKIRLAEIDAPEKAQAFGKDSTRSLSGMVLGKQVQVSSQATDQYGRMVAHLSINGLDVNAEQIRRGMAWEYSNFHSNKALIALQAEAKQAALGLWAQDHPTPPWAWRKQHPAISPAQPDAASAVIPAPAIPSSPLCGSKKHCSDMASCEEARRYFAACGITALDGDKDGAPCEKLCGGGKR